MCVADLDDRLSRAELIGWLAYYSLLGDEERIREHNRSAR